MDIWSDVQQHPSFKKKQLQNKCGYKTCSRTYSSSMASSIRRCITFGGTLKKTNKNTSSLSMSLCLVDRKNDAGFGDSTASKNPQQTSYGMSPSASASETTSSPSSSTTPTKSTQDEGRRQEQPLGSAASTEKKKKMSEPTNNTTIGVISVVGRRRSMEEAVTVAPGLFHVAKPDPGKRDGVGFSGYDFFAVYNGQGSHTVANTCKERLHQVVAEQSNVVGAGRWESVMVSSFARMNEEVGLCTLEHDDLGLADVAGVGSMALVVLVCKEEIVVANCGHSRAVLYRDGAAVPLCRHHQPETQEGSQKEQMISKPEVTVHQRTSSDGFLVIATDGLWNVVSNEMACDIVKQRRSGELTSKKVFDGMIRTVADDCAAMLVELALARGSKDNISVIVVELQHLSADGNSSSTY